ncbi:MAG: hypothetical protein HY057_03010 [Rhodospirillales bacterium]|nr:hypothetical protein [Rhodospirillales bacterium]
MAEKRGPSKGRRRFLTRLAAAGAGVGALAACAPEARMRAAGLPAGETATPAQARTGQINIRDFGARGDGRNDDTAAIQAAIDAVAEQGGGEVLIPPMRAPYRVTSLQLRSGVQLVGAGPWADSGFAAPRSVLQGTPGQDVIVLAPVGESVFNYGLRDFAIVGGRNHLVSPDAAVWVTIRNVRFQKPGEAGIRVRGFVQNWYLENVDFAQGRYGWLQEAAPSRYPGAGSLLDKCVFRAVTCSGQTKNGFRIEVAISNNVLFDALSLIQIAEHGFVLDGGIRAWTFINVNTEGNNYNTLSKPEEIRQPGQPLERIAARARPITTGSIGADSRRLVVAQQAGFANGDTVNIEGAGADGLDLDATIVAGAGTTHLTLSRPAARDVRDVEVTSAQFSDFFIGNSVGGVAGITWIDAAIGHPNGGGASRYALDASRAAGPMIFIGGSAPRPIYDPYNKLSVLGNASVPLRRREPDFRTETFTSFTIGALNARTQIPSGRGRDIVLALVDSAGDGSGGHGKLEVRRYDPNRTRLLELDAEGRMALRGERLGFGGHNNHGIFTGDGTPEGRVAALPGSLYLRRDGGPGSSLYVKEKGADVWGWAAK